MEDIDIRDIPLEGSEELPDIPLEGSEELPSITNEANGNIIICQGHNGNNQTNNYNSVKPYVGMEFSTHNEAYSYYDAYAKENGFKIRREALDKSRKVSKTIISRVFSCNRSGKKRLTDRREIGKCINRRPDTRVGCAGKMRIKLTASNTWMISKFVEEHTNHDLTIHDISSIRSYRVSRNNELVTPKQCTNGKPCVQLIKDLQKRMENNPDFFFAFELDDNLTVTSVIWVDKQTKIAYSKFGDVLVFDIACRTNAWNMSFASFTGVNHHRQSILFGCALLSNEKYESFTWLFRQWLLCMNGKAPKAIVTYQDSQICGAVKKVFPNTPYRFCPWHVRKHMHEHSASLKTLYGDEFTDYFYKWAYGTSIEQCEQYWDIMKKKFNVEEEGHYWLTEMYCLRECWVDAYLKKEFWAGMSTGQHKERVEAFFDNYIDSHIKPEDFVQQYYKAVDERRASESLEDSRTLNRTPAVCISHPLEVQVGKIYSATMLRLFQEELVGGLLLCNEEVFKDGLTSVYIYNVGHRSEDKGKWQEVIFDASGKVEVSCTCGKFETDGILCRHILKVLHDREVQVVPRHYILQRWSMNARSDNATKTKVKRNVFKDGCEHVKL